MLFFSVLKLILTTLGKIRGPLVDQIGAVSHIKLPQIGVDEKGFSSV